MSGSSKPAYVHFNTNTSPSHAVLLIISFHEHGRVSEINTQAGFGLSKHLPFTVLHFIPICETASCNFTWIPRSSLDWVNEHWKVLGISPIFPPLSPSHIRIGAGLPDPAIFDEEPGLLKSVHLFSFMFMFLADNV